MLIMSKLHDCALWWNLQMSSSLVITFPFCSECPMNNTPLLTLIQVTLLTSHSEYSFTLTILCFTLPHLTSAVYCPSTSVLEHSLNIDKIDTWTICEHVEQQTNLQKILYTKLYISCIFGKLIKKNGTLHKYSLNSLEHVNIM